MEGRLFRVETSSPNQKALLESEYLTERDHFVVPANETETVEAIICSQFFQYFQTSLPAIALKIKEFACRSLTFNLSLTLLREILALLSDQCDSLRQLRQYFLAMNKELAEGIGSEEGLPSEPQHSQEEDNDYLFDLAGKGEIRATRLLEQIDLCEEIQAGCKLFEQPKALTISTRETGALGLNPEEIQFGLSAKLPNNILSNFYSAQIVGGQDWWKNQNKISEQSKEISNFDRRGAKIMSQKSITRMLVDQMKRDLNREIELGREGEKQQQGLFRFNKMARGKLAQAKLKKRSRK